MTYVIMPKQGLQMEEGIITNWLVKEGENVTVGQPLFEMDTDKVTLTVESKVSGKLVKILQKEGDTVPVGENVAIIE